MSEAQETDNPVTCASCGRQEATSPLDWTFQVTDRGRVEHLCPACARANVRSIEGRLDTAWW